MSPSHASETEISIPPCTLVRRCARAAGDGVYIGAGANGWVWAPPQHGVLVIGPPRSGKTSSIVIPAIAAANGPVVSTSTKSEVMASTWRARREIGRCFLFDPTGTVSPPEGVEILSWSPVDSAGDWDRALSLAHSLVATARPPTRDGAERHWTERAESLLAPLLHATARLGRPMSQVVSWVNRHDATEALEFLLSAEAGTAADLLHGIAETDRRELSGIWSTASGVLSSYRSDAARANADGRGTRFDVGAFPSSADTIYVCAAGRSQSLVAPLIVGLLDEIRTEAYRQADSGGVPHPMLFALDEIANIAPIPDLAALVSEGGGQGVTTLACIQDLSQARIRWGTAADGFFTLFGTKVAFPGIADRETVDTICRLAGTVQTPNASLTAPHGLSAFHQGTSITWSLREHPVLPPEAISRGEPGTALVMNATSPPTRVRLTPCFSSEPWVSIVDSPADRHVGIEMAAGRPSPGVAHQR